MSGGAIEALLFSYRVGLGDFDFGAVGTTNSLLVTVFIFLATLFLCVIMLNLLIAVISESFAAV
jgi:hypothetical protein